MRKDFGVVKAQETFSWILLTSACLSRGAQGDIPSKRPAGSDALEYANFELGLLFCSRLQGNPYTDRLYCWKPAQCTCTTPASGNLSASNQTRRGPRLIHMPVPFSFRPVRYQEDEDEMTFCETPYFHEIPNGTITKGYMRCTPLGAAECERKQDF